MSILDNIQLRIEDWESDPFTPISITDLQRWSEELNRRIHIAVMVEPYLSKICSGEKYIESRLSKVNMSPFERAGAGDVLLFKRSGGSLRAIAEVQQVLFQELTPGQGALDLAQTFADGLGYEPGYAESKAAARYASLLWLREVRPIKGVPLGKRSRQSWVTIQPDSRREKGPSIENGLLF